MGFCLPALIAAQTQHKNELVLGIATAVQHNLPLKLIIFNNGILQNVMAQQQYAFGTTITNPNFVQLAEAYGCYGFEVNDVNNLPEALSLLFSKNDKPFVLSIKIDPNLQVPLSKWQTTIHH